MWGLDGLWRGPVQQQTSRRAATGAVLMLRPEKTSHASHLSVYPLLVSGQRLVVSRNNHTHTHLILATGFRVYMRASAASEVWGRERVPLFIRIISLIYIFFSAYTYNIYLSLAHAPPARRTHARSKSPNTHTHTQQAGLYTTTRRSQTQRRLGLCCCCWLRLYSIHTGGDTWLSVVERCGSLRESARHAAQLIQIKFVSISLSLVCVYKTYKSFYQQVDF